MKALLLIGAVVAIASAVPTSREHWEQFKKEYGKSYKNLKEEQKRLEIFQDNLRKIEEHNDKYKAGSATYYMKINTFSDLNTEELGALLNGFNRTGQLSSRKMSGLKFAPLEGVQLPESVDWREKGAVTPIKNQGTCGSCWAFSTTGAMEGQLFRKTGKLVPLSEQQLMDCSSSYGNMGCNGGLMDYAFAYINEAGGLQSEESYPYEGDVDRCRFRSNKIVEGTSVQSVVDIPEGDDEALKAAVATVGPISVAVSATNIGFMHYGGGVFSGDTCNPGRLDHGVLVVGYGSENGQDYWIIKNSWNTVWGENGYMKLARNSDVCGISTMASYPVL